MAIRVSQSFKRTSAEPIDETMALTKAEMRAVDDNTMPTYYFTVCQEDGKFYVYDKSAEFDEVTGKFRELETGTSITIDDELSLTSENPVQNKVITANIKYLTVENETERLAIQEYAEQGTIVFQKSNNKRYTFLGSNTWIEESIGGTIGIIPVNPTQEEIETKGYNIWLVTE